MDAKDRLLIIGADALACIGFYTRLPIRTPETGRPLAAAMWAAPIAGALVGLVSGLVLITCLRLGLPAGAAAAAALAAAVLLTGALHEDGLADVADGFGGGVSREDKLAIMRDSRIGTYGTLALVLSALARWSALAALAAASSMTVLAAIVAAHAASRALQPAFSARVPRARTDGLSVRLGAVEARPALVGLGLAALLLLPLGLAPAMAAIAVLAAIFAGMERLCRAQIGGQTGDVLGALQQLAEIAILLVVAAFMESI